ncbi:MAG: helix-turn-helix transcriptional regulator [Desulfobacteraceae bacterium]|nr:helix-turn-helix transcriptional regulator [Desulfobacteraceae bacterium]
MERKKRVAVKVLLFEKNFTQRELSRETGIPESILSMFINGKYILDGVEQSRIAKVLGCPVERLSVGGG